MSNSRHKFRGFAAPPPPQMPAVAVDRFGNMIEKGHLVMFHAEEDLVFEVIDVRPVLNPSIPPDQRVMQVMFRAEFPVQFRAATPNRGMVICGMSQARQQEIAENNGQPAMVDEAALPTTAPPSGLVLTDAPDLPTKTVEEAAAPLGKCPACGEKGAVGTLCEMCGDAQCAPQKPVAVD